MRETLTRLQQAVQKYGVRTALGRLHASFGNTSARRPLDSSSGSLQVLNTSSKDQKKSLLIDQAPSSTAPALCANCKDIDWHSIIQQLHHKYALKTVAGVYTNLPPWQVTPGKVPAFQTCPMCTMFANFNRDVTRDRICLISEVLQNPINAPSVPAARLTPVIAVKGESDDVFRVIGIVNERIPNTFRAPRIMDPHHIEFAMLRNWHQQCVLTHKERCCPYQSDPLPGFRVLHCQSRSVIDAPPGCAYAALSYVWGNTSTKESQFPRTIEDSIQIALEIGYEYLCELHSSTATSCCLNLSCGKSLT